MNALQGQKLLTELGGELSSLDIINCEPNGEHHSGKVEANRGHSIGRGHAAIPEKIHHSPHWTAFEVRDKANTHQIEAQQTGTRHEIDIGELLEAKLSQGVVFVLDGKPTG